MVKSDIQSSTGTDLSRSGWGVRAGSWFMSMLLAHKKRGLLHDLRQRPKFSPEEVVDTSRFPNYWNFRRRVMLARLVCHITPHDDLGYQNRNHVQASLQNYMRMVKKRLSRVYLGNFLVSTPCLLPIRPAERNGCFAYLLRPFLCSPSDLFHCQMYRHLLRT